MKEVNFRYTNHDSYSLARSFLLMAGMIIFASVPDFLLLSLPVDWQAAGTVGVAVRAVCMVISGGFGIYLSFKLSLRLFDGQGSISMTDSEITLKTGKKVQKAAIKDIVEVRKDIFAKFDGLRFKDSKAFGPLYTRHSIVTKEQEFFALASVKEGWEKAGKEVFAKENPMPIYSIDGAFKVLSVYVDEIKKQENEEAEYLGETEKQ